MLVGPQSQWPMELAIGRRDRQFVDARMSRVHQALFVKLPILIPVGAKPVSRIIVVLICETYCDSIFAKRPQLFDQAVIQLSGPLSREKGNDLLSPVCELGPVSPTRVDGVGERDLRGVTRVPAIFGKANLFDCAFQSERR